MLASMLGKQHYPQCSQIDERQQETESYFWQSFWQSENNINRDIDKVESILDSSLDDFNQSVKNDATPSMYQHDDEAYYDDDPDDGVEILQKEIRQYEDKDGGNQRPAKQRLTKQSSEEPSEQPREEPRNTGETATKNNNTITMTTVRIISTTAINWRGHMGLNRLIKSGEEPNTMATKMKWQMRWQMRWRMRWQMRWQTRWQMGWQMRWQRKWQRKWQINSGEKPNTMATRICSAIVQHRIRRYALKRGTPGFFITPRVYAVADSSGLRYRFSKNGNVNLK